MLDLVFLAVLATFGLFSWSLLRLCVNLMGGSR